MNSEPVPHDSSAAAACSQYDHSDKLDVHSPHAANEMLVVLSAPLVHVSTASGQRHPVPPLDQERELGALAAALEAARRALRIRVIFANTGSLKMTLSTSRPVLLHFSGHVCDAF